MRRAGGRVVVVGSLNMDLVVRAPHLPQPGETVLGSDYRTFPGGKGANQAVAAARLGAPVAMVGRVGADAFGDTLLAGLQAAGVEITQIGRDAARATGIALITVDATGQNTIVVAPGANAALTPALVEQAEAVFRAAAVVLLQLETPLPVVARAAELARRHGATVVLNPAPPPPQPLPAALLALIDVLVLNETELAALSGLPLDAPATAAIDRLRAAGARRLVATLGADGALVVDVDGAPGHLPAHHVEVVDTTAAGDAFVGALGAALAAGRPLAEAARHGNAAGALAVTRAGAQPSLPTRAEFEAFRQGVEAGRPPR